MFVNIYSQQTETGMYDKSQIACIGQKEDGRYDLRKGGGDLIRQTSLLH
jgi:hypothetical protein